MTVHLLIPLDPIHVRPLKIGENNDAVLQTLVIPKVHRIRTT